MPTGLKEQSSSEDQENFVQSDCLTSQFRYSHWHYNKTPVLQEKIDGAPAGAAGTDPSIPMVNSLPDSGFLKPEQFN